jgi:isopentenyl-diphosphate delta-isomerase
MDGVKVILVDEKDNPIGVAEKMEAHRKGLLHRAFSIFIFNRNGQMLLQQRALNKYHSAGLWTNACCSHPVPDEPIEETIQRRLKEEMGFETPVEKVFDFNYFVEFGNGIIENEFDHVFVGEYNDTIQSNAEEVMNWGFVSMDKLAMNLRTEPGRFTEWFKLALPKMYEWWRLKYHADA